MKILVNLFHSNLEKSTVNRRWLRELGRIWKTQAIRAKITV